MKKSYIFAVGAIALWSTMATISKLLLDKMDSYKVLFLSTFFAFIVMLITNLACKKWQIMKTYSFKDYLKMALIGLPGVFLYYVFYYEGSAKMAASQAFIINYLWPIMSVVFACIVLKEKMTVRKIVAVLLSFVGVFTVAGEDLINFNAQSVLGVFLCFLAAVSYGLYTALNKKCPYDKQVLTTVAMLSAALPSLVVVLLRGENVMISFKEVPGILWNGVFTMAIANLLWTLALAKGNTAKISNLAYITPFLSLVWTFFVLNEPIKPLSVLGLCIIVIGIFIQLKGDKKELK